jgi:hypothetical protein
LSTEAENTDVSVPILAWGTGTFLGSFIVELASGTIDSADEAVVGLAAGAFAISGSYIVDSASSTCDTDDSVPG